MKKSMTAIMVFVLLSFLASEICFAGLINYDRRNRAAAAATNAANNPAPQNTANQTPSAPAPAAAAAYAMNENSAAQENAKGTFKVNNRVEQIYDANKDEILQPEEVNAFLKDVVSAVDKKGSFSASSDVLKPWDKDGDGKISKAEVNAIEAAIR